MAGIDLGTIAMRLGLTKDASWGTVSKSAQDELKAVGKAADAAGQQGQAAAGKFAGVGQALTAHQAGIAAAGAALTGMGIAAGAAINGYMLPNNVNYKCSY